MAINIEKKYVLDLNIVMLYLLVLYFCVSNNLFLRSGLSNININSYTQYGPLKFYGNDKY